jgi:antitoxin PrlF
MFSIIQKLRQKILFLSDVDRINMNSYSKSMKTQVTERGQITIPKAIRIELGIRPGTVIDFDLIDGKIVGTKKEPQDSLRTWRGKGRLPEGFLSVDAYLNEVRE